VSVYTAISRENVYQNQLVNFVASDIKVMKTLQTSAEP